MLYKTRETGACCTEQHLNRSVFFCYTKQEINIALKNFKQKIKILSSPKFKKSYVFIVLSSQTMFVFVMN